MEENKNKSDLDDLGNLEEGIKDINNISEESEGDSKVPIPSEISEEFAEDTKDTISTDIPSPAKVEKPQEESAEGSELGGEQEEMPPEKVEEEIEEKKGEEKAIEEEKGIKRSKKEKEEKEKKERILEFQETAGPKVFALRTTANREDQVMDFITSNIEKKKDLRVYAVVRPHGMRGYIFIEAETKHDAELAAMGIPYARGVLSQPVPYKEIDPLLEQVKHEVDIRKNDIAEIISGPFKREKCKITRIDKAKEEVVVELLEAAVPIPITVKMDAIKVIRREGEPEEKEG
ncbi:MAG: transcription elongation factor Spt5 [Candidatus Woesearchaeota archaeon]|nr:transcription elongation factor Spt5 [Candidatus Woesearchaeota archaeon]